MVGKIMQFRICLLYFGGVGGLLKALRIETLLSSIRYWQLMLNGTLSSSHCRKAVAPFSDKLSKPYTSHSWKGAFTAVVVTRRASSAWLYLKLPQPVLFLLKIIAPFLLRRNEMKAVFSCGKRIAVDFYIFAEFDGCVFIRPAPPGEGLIVGILAARRHAVRDQSSPDLASLHSRAAIGDRDVGIGADGLGY